MNDNLPDIKEYKKYNYKLTPFKLCVLQNFPFIEADFDAITNYQLLCKVVEYLNRVIDNQNTVEDNFKIMADNLNTLYNFLDTLDLQDEVNNKLDEMTESGTLQEIISEYLNSKAIFGFDNVESMKNATNLINGSYAKTLGYYNKNDGGDGLYKIRNITNDDIVDNAKIIEMANNNLIAELIESDIINVKNYGAYGDGIHDDINYIQLAINSNPLKTIYFPNGTYLISEHIYTSATENEKVYLKLDKNAIIKANSTYQDNYILHLGEFGIVSNYNNSINKSGIEGGIIDTNNKAGGIYTEKTHLSTIKNIDIINLGNFAGIYTSISNNASSDITIENINVKGLDPKNLDSVGFYIHSADNVLNNCRPSGVHIGAKISTGGNYLNNVHALYNNDNIFTDYDTSIAFQINSNNNTLNDCYSDNYGVGIQLTGSFYTYINNFFQLWFSAENQNHTFMECINFATLKAFINGLTLQFPDNGINTIIKSSSLTKSLGFIKDINFNDAEDRITNPLDLGLNPIYNTETKDIKTEDIILQETSYNITQNHSYTENRKTSIQLAISGVNGTQGTSQTIATLPLGCRPSSTSQINAYTNISDTITPLNAWITSSGTIRLTPNQNLSNRIIYINANY